MHREWGENVRGKRVSVVGIEVRRKSIVYLKC